ncbi:MAG: hypothetical protein ACI4EN_01985 [Butyrivibrio sp.]
MNKKVFLLLLSCICIILSGCTVYVNPANSNMEKSNYTPESNTTPAVTDGTSSVEYSTELPTPEETLIPDDELNTIQKILLNMEEFIDTEDGQYKKVEDIRGFYMLDTYTYYASHFFRMDLDGNGTEEVVAVMSGIGTRMIFYEIDGNIYMDQIFANDMAPVFTDGVFERFCNVRTGSLDRIKEFTTDGIVTETMLITYVPDMERIYYTNWDDFDNEVNSITAEEADRIKNSHSTIEIEEYEFNRKNVETILID